MLGSLAFNTCLTHFSWSVTECRFWHASKMRLVGCRASRIEFADFQHTSATIMQLLMFPGITFQLRKYQLPALSQHLGRRGADTKVDIACMMYPYAYTQAPVSLSLPLYIYILTTLYPCHFFTIFFYQFSSSGPLGAPGGRRGPIFDGLGCPRSDF